MKLKALSPCADLDHTADIQIHSCERMCSSIELPAIAAPQSPEGQCLCRGPKSGGRVCQCRPGHVQLHDSPVRRERG